MEPIASPTRSDLLQKINEKYHVNSDYLLREIAGEYAIFRWDCPSDFECSDGSKRYRCISGMLFSSHVPFRKSLHRR